LASGIFPALETSNPLLANGTGAPASTKDAFLNSASTKDAFLNSASAKDAFLNGDGGQSGLMVAG
jgi:hypothetical protein